ncbi:hypothetical protein [Dyadobacter psychrotolerans]|uniref:Uncharacterized protein n=1 Tax=Dyadobacter psychrotolerans TaxID=2541721 RepID=A0A4R5DUB0_9BACT|nr:hypothetical protein [Dyadobacter psychrotolerans]TDE14785.1 hypothetical protein E0F88_16495 [Dyadobacter psychrotolerans]
MENSEAINAKDYQNQLLPLVGLNTVSNLQQRFSEEIRIGLSVQEDIWMRSSGYLRTKGISITLPENKKYKGRYTQFPLSQVILNAEDLKEYIDIFRKIEMGESPISKDCFLEDFRPLANNSLFTRINNKKLNWQEVDDLAELQIFNFFCGNWKNINYPEKDKIGKAAFGQKDDTSEVDLLLIKNGNTYEFYLNKKIVLPNSNLFKLPFRDKTTLRNNILIFKEIDGYENEFELTKDSQLGEKLIFVLNRGYNRQIEQFLLSNYSPISLCSELVLFEVQFYDSANIPEALRHFVRQPYPIKLRGFKVSRRFEYFEGFGPHIEPIDLQIIYSVYHEGTKQEYERDKVKIGEYKVRIPGFTDLKFRVISKTKLLDKIEPRNAGWNVIRMVPFVQDHHLQGARLIAPSQKSQLPLMRAWLGTCRGQIVKETDNQLLKILNVVKNGH